VTFTKSCFRRSYIVLPLSVVFLAAARQADAQVTSLGATNSGLARSGVYSAVAYDDKHDVYLQVWEDNGNAAGRFVAFDGTPAGDVFVIATPLNASSSQISRPRVAYTQGTADDKFVVFYTDRLDGSEFTGTAYMLPLRYTGTGSAGGVFLDAPRRVLAEAFDFQFASDIVFNPIQREFLLVWLAGPYSALCGPNVIVLGRYTVALTAIDGPKEVGMQAPPCVLPDLASWRYLRPSATFDWQRNRYFLQYEFVTFSVHAGLMYNTEFLALDADLTGNSQGSAQLSGVNCQGSDDCSGTQVPTFLPELPGYLSAWEHVSATPPAFDIVGAVVPWNSTASSTTVPVFNTIHRPGKWSERASLAYDPLSRRVLAIAEGSESQTTHATSLVGTLLDGVGNVVNDSFSVPTQVSSATYLNPFVRATHGGQFVVSYIADSGAMLERFSVPVAAAPGPRFSNVNASLDAPPDGATVGLSFDVGGWAFDFGTAAGTGIDAVHVWALPAGGGSPVFVGADTSFHTRPDIGAFFGSHFSGAGFDLTASLSLGHYTIAAYAHSALSGTFTLVGTSAITVAPQPRMGLDTPSDSSTIAGAFSVDGWAIDQGIGLSGGSGVDAVHVWAFPSGGLPMFVGVAECGGPRPDIGALFGSQYTNSGFHLGSVSLPPGTYRIVAFAHSTVTNTFAISQSASVTITLPDSQPMMSIDRPSDSTVLSVPFQVAGWAIDRASGTGPGVDAVHVWAFPVGGSSAIFVGVGTLGGPRADIGAFFGPQFADSGYSCTVTGLPPLTYDLAVYARSSVTGVFNQVRVVRISVQ
jgi:hypothetical protein